MNASISGALVEVWPETMAFCFVAWQGEEKLGFEGSRVFGEEGGFAEGEEEQENGGYVGKEEGGADLEGP